MKHPIDTVFFDLDGTLTDPRVGITRCINHALTELGEPSQAEAELLWCIGPPLRESFVHLVGEARADAAVGFYRERFSEIGLFENAVFDGVPQLLNDLSGAGLTLHVASSKPHVFVERILERFELRGAFDQVFGAEFDGTRGDKPSLLAHALSQTGAVPGRSMMIGDRKHDVEGALANGLSSVGVLYGFGSREELERAGVDELVEGPCEILELLTHRGV